MRYWLQAAADIPGDPEIDVDLTGSDYFFSPEGTDSARAEGRDEGSEALIRRTQEIASPCHTA
jgi:hypothetical protein